MTDPDPTPDFTACPNWGKGGRYIYDPATGQRTPVIDPDSVVTEEHTSNGTGQPMTATPGDTLTVQSAKKGK